MNEVESYADKDVEILLLGNKSDLKEEKTVDERTVKVISKLNDFLLERITLKKRIWNSSK